MKKIIIIFIALITLQVTAQDKKKQYNKEDQKERKEAMKDLSPEQMATLQTKKMTLHLNLNEAQQNKMQSFFLEEAKFRKAKMVERKTIKDSSEMKTFTKEDKFKMMNERLDHQIEVKQKMKSILNEEQFEKWEYSMGKMEHNRHREKKIEKEKNKQ
jgi:protein CpxP